MKLITLAHAIPLGDGYLQWLLQQEKHLKIGWGSLAIAFGVDDFMADAPRIGLFWGRNWGRNWGIALGLEAWCFHGLWIQW
jgi:hypothetical protein